MAMRVKTNVKAQKNYGPCQVCGKPIEAGTQYQWAKGFRGPKLKRHQSCPTWKASELETGALASALAAQEAAHAALDDLPVSDYKEGHVDYESIVTDVRTVLETCASDAEEARDETQESLDNMPEGLQEGDVGQMLQERIDNLESWFDDLTRWSPTRDEPEEDEDPQEWFDEMVSEARELLDSLEA